MIDAYISDRPVFSRKSTCTRSGANTCAIEKVGVTRDTPDPVGGKILKDENGDLTGIFSNNAGALFMDQVHNPPLERAKESLPRRPGAR